VTAEFTLPVPIAIAVVSSSIGPLDTQLLADGINDILKTIVLPWLNYRGQHQVLGGPVFLALPPAFASGVTPSQGFAILVPPGLQLSNTTVTVGDSFVAISSDLHLASDF
jgi:hypothetical protein